MSFPNCQSELWFLRFGRGAWYYILFYNELALGGGIDFLGIWGWVSTLTMLSSIYCWVKFSAFTISGSIFTADYPPSIFFSCDYIVFYDTLIFDESLGTPEPASLASFAVSSLGYLRIIGFFLRSFVETTYLLFLLIYIFLCFFLPLAGLKTRLPSLSKAG